MPRKVSDGEVLPTTRRCSGQNEGTGWHNRGAQGEIGCPEGFLRIGKAASRRDPLDSHVCVAGSANEGEATGYRVDGRGGSGEGSREVEGMGGEGGTSEGGEGGVCRTEEVVS